MQTPLTRFTATFLAWFLAAMLVPAAALAQRGSASEGARIEQGRQLLARGDAVRAAQLARTLLAEFPKSVEVLAFAIDAQTVTSGSQAALQTYNRWFTTNNVEVPAALHQIARAVLREMAVPQGDASTRFRALEALASDGDADAAGVLAAESEKQGAAGPAPPISDKAISELIATAQNGMTTGERRRAILALGATKSQRAALPLIAVLSDPNPDVRAAAAEALGNLRVNQAVLPLQALLNDPVFAVRYHAATALFAMNDASGLAWLRELESSPQPGIRLAAVQATRAHPDGNWLSVVRELTNVGDADVRRQAAELLAPHDAAAAKSVLTALLSDQNIALRDMAQTSLVETETDFNELRRYIGAGKSGSRLIAAARLLYLTR